MPIAPQPAKDRDAIVAFPIFHQDRVASALTSQSQCKVEAENQGQAGGFGDDRGGPVASDDVQIGAANLAQTPKLSC